MTKGNMVRFSAKIKKDGVLLYRAMSGMKKDAALWESFLGNLATVTQQGTAPTGAATDTGTYLADTQSYPVGSAAQSIGTITINQATAPSMNDSMNSEMARTTGASGGTGISVASYDGETFKSFLPGTVVFAVKAFALLPAAVIPGCVYTALIQTLLGSKAGLALLAALCYGLTR
jgi:hypothetical protein